MSIRKEIVLLGIVVIVGAGCRQTLYSQKEYSPGAPSLDGNNNKYNVIFITLSSLRADHVGAYGYHRDTTPCFDEFTKKSILFENAYAVSSWQMPAHGSLLTSLYPNQHGSTHITRKLKKTLTLPGYLKEHGYYTAGICFNPRLTEENGFAQGFDFYDDYSANIMQFSEEESETTNGDQKRTNDVVNDIAIQWVRKNTHHPFFLFVHYYDTHWDYLPQKPYDTLYDGDYKGVIDGTRISKEPLYSNKPSDRDIEHLIALYDGEVRQEDEDLTELLKLLKQEGRFEDSIILIMGDHGEQFYEHGNTSHHGLYDEMVHVPLAISIPGQSPRRIASLISGVDVMPTIIDILTIPVPGACKGTSALSVIQGKTNIIRDSVFMEYTGGAIPDVYAVRSNAYKYIIPKNSAAFAFNLKDDPREEKLLSPDLWPPEVKELEDNCAKMLMQMGDVIDKESADVTETATDQEAALEQ